RAAAARAGEPRDLRGRRPPGDTVDPRRAGLGRPHRPGGAQRPAPDLTSGRTVLDGRGVLGEGIGLEPGRPAYVHEPNAVLRARAEGGEPLGVQVGDVALVRFEVVRR